MVYCPKNGAPLRNPLRTPLEDSIMEANLYPLEDNKMDNKMDNKKDNNYDKKEAAFALFKEGKTALSPEVMDFRLRSKEGTLPLWKLK